MAQNPIIDHWWTRLSRCYFHTATTAMVWCAWHRRHDKVCTIRLQAFNPLIFYIDLPRNMSPTGFISTQSERSNSTPNVPTSRLYAWQRPSAGFYTCNLDVTLFNDLPSFSYECCICDSNGYFIKAKSSCTVGSLTVYEA